MIKAIIFDCFGVLYVNSGQLFYETNVPNYQQIKNELKELDKQADYGLITQDELAEQVADLSGLNQQFVSDNLQGHKTLNQPLLCFIEQMRPKYRVGMLSNISSSNMDMFFTKSERERYFDTVVLSGEVGLIKPHPEIYRLTAKKLGVAPAECIMIDDSLDNCYGADAARMEWIHYKSYTEAVRELSRVLHEGM